MKTLVLANQKGGVGKSAVATLLAYHFAQKGQRVLAIDLDHQGNLSRPLQASKRAAVAGFTSDLVMTSGATALPASPFALVPFGPDLLAMERQPQQHTPFARAMRAFLVQAAAQFDVCVIDTNPNPDIRLIAALASADFVLSPIQLNQEALDGVTSLLNHERVGLRKIKAVLNPRLHFIGLLPTLVEPTPFQKENFVQVIERYGSLMIRIGDGAGQFARIPKRSAIAEAQAAGEVLWEMKKTAARDAWREIEPSIVRIATIVTSVQAPEPSHAAAA
ncbi:MAG: ParA family protein [Burkholderiaceae bacterium]|nr:ParA family protein [Burkholderiaceae bacterium]